ncbi:MAG: hypothetical protein CL927_17730 [Deltaproteobacteria bacterium]|nr:hypothetical protein [Deltaproteobacteria bacterium]HCH63972.1 hypothetical protein [Deltaproteobacteria bacterium]
MGLGGSMLWWVGRWLVPPVPIELDFAQMQVLSRPLAPLLDLLGAVEGEYHSVNRGRAGDSPGRWATSHLGMPITDMTLAQVRTHQAGADERCWFRGVAGAAGLFAVGRYQLIPCTLHGALRRVDGLTLEHKFDAATQDGLAVYLLLVKRRRLGGWLLGYRHGYAAAAQELAQEFASVPIQSRHRKCVRGQSYYCGDSAGNAALLSLDAVHAALHAARAELEEDAEAAALIAEAEGIRGQLRRAAKAQIDTWILALKAAGEPE